MHCELSFANSSRRRRAYRLFLFVVADSVRIREIERDDMRTGVSEKTTNVINDSS